MTPSGESVSCYQWLTKVYHCKLSVGSSAFCKTGSSKHLRQGVPQGCVLSPLLFLFFIDNLADHLMSEDPVRAALLIFSLFAEDVTILARDRSRDTAAADAQWAVNCVVKWSEDWKLNHLGNHHSRSMASPCLSTKLPNCLACT